MDKKNQHLIILLVLAAVVALGYYLNIYQKKQSRLLAMI